MDKSPGRPLLRRIMTAGALCRSVLPELPPVNIGMAGRAFFRSGLIYNRITIIRPDMALPTLRLLMSLSKEKCCGTLMLV